MNLVEGGGPRRSMSSGDVQDAHAQAHGALREGPRCLWAYGAQCSPGAAATAMSNCSSRITPTSDGAKAGEVHAHETDAPSPFDRQLTLSLRYHCQAAPVSPPMFDEGPRMARSCARNEEDLAPRLSPFEGRSRTPLLRSSGISEDVGPYLPETVRELLPAAPDGSSRRRCPLPATAALRALSPTASPRCRSAQAGIFGPGERQQIESTVLSRNRSARRRRSAAASTRNRGAALARDPPDRTDRLDRPG